MSARARNLRANKNSIAGGGKNHSKDSNTSLDEDYYRRIHIQPAIVDTPMSPRTEKWVRELTPVLEPYNFDMNEISDLIHRCHYDANQIELAVGNVIEDFSGHESGQWTKVGKNRPSNESKSNNNNNNNNNNNTANRNKSLNSTNKYGKQTYTPNSQNPNHTEVNRAGHNKPGNRPAKSHNHGNYQNHNHSHQARVTGEQGAQGSPSNASKSNNTTKASISNSPVDNSTTWAKLARKNNNNSNMDRPTNAYNEDGVGAASELEAATQLNSDRAIGDIPASSDTAVQGKSSHDHTANDEQEYVHDSPKPLQRVPDNTVRKEYERSSDIISDSTQSFTPPTSNMNYAGFVVGSGATAVELGIKVGGVSPPPGIQIGGGMDYRSHGIGVFLPEGRTIDPNASEGLIFGSFGTVDVSRIHENHIQMNNHMISEGNINMAHNISAMSPTNSSNMPGGQPNIGAMPGMAVPEHNGGIGANVGPGGNILNGWTGNGSSPSKDGSSGNVAVDPALIHQNASQRNGGAGVPGSNVHNMKSSAIGNGYMGHSMSGGAVGNYNNLPMAGGQGMVGAGGVYSSNPAIISGNNGVNYNEAVVNNGANSNNNNTGNNAGGNGSNMALAAAAAAAAAAVNPYNYAYLNYAGYTANFPYVVGNTAAFGFPHYNNKPSGHHHPAPVFNQYSQAPNPNQHGLNGVYGMSGAGNNGNAAVNGNASGSSIVSDNINVNYHASNNQAPIAVGSSSTTPSAPAATSATSTTPTTTHVSNQNSNNYQNIQSMLPPGMPHQQMNMNGQQPNGNGAMQNQMNMPMGFNNGGANEYGVEQAMPQTVFLGQPGTASNKLENIGNHQGDFIHQGYNNHHVHIPNQPSNANMNSQGNPNPGNPSNHTKGSNQGAAPGNFQGNMQYINKPSGSGSSNTGSATPNNSNGNSAPVNPSGAVNGANVNTGMELNHQNQGTGSNSGSGNSNMFISGRAQNSSSQPVQVGSGQQKQASVNFPGFHSSRNSNNSTGFLQHNNNMWNNN
ncbi:hypothetical protein OIY81_2618 [Cryptosporidium canis]|nr:hypothetical protein OIY81_2618 [Cryptosporidium canis]